MWTTLDGHTLRISRPVFDALVDRYRRFSARLPGAPAGRRTVDPSRVVAYVLGQIARRARHSGRLQPVGAGSAHPVFTSDAYGQSFRLVTRPLDGAGQAIVSVQEAGGPEYSDGPGHARAQVRLHDALLRQGLTDADIRWNRRQVRGIAGRSIPNIRNMPDLSYVGDDGLRVNVEIDTTLPGSLNHQRTLLKNDPHARHIFLIVDPRTGEVTGRRDFDPRRGVSRDSGPHFSASLPRPRTRQRLLPFGAPRSRTPSRAGAPPATRPAVSAGQRAALRGAPPRSVQPRPPVRRGR